MTYPRPTKRTHVWISITQNIISELFSSINFKDLLSQAQLTIENFDYCGKKTIFKRYTVNEELHRFREITSVFMYYKLRQEGGVDSVCYRSLFRRTTKISQGVLMELFYEFGSESFSLETFLKN